MGQSGLCLVGVSPFKNFLQWEEEAWGRDTAKYEEESEAFCILSSHPQEMRENGTRKRPWLHRMLHIFESPSSLLSLSSLFKKIFLKKSSLVLYQIRHKESWITGFIRTHKEMIIMKSDQLRDEWWWWWASKSMCHTSHPLSIRPGLQFISIFTLALSSKERFGNVRD